MASYTAFLNIEKPTTSERLDVLKINSNWDKIDAGVSALNSQIADFMIYNLNDSGTSLPATLTVPNNSRHLILINGPYANRGRAVFLVNANASGTVQAVKIGGDDAVSATPGSNSLVISDTGGSTTISLFTVLTSLGNKITI